MTMTTECPNTEMQSFPQQQQQQQVIVGILVPAGPVNFPSYQAIAAPAIYAKPEGLVYMPQGAHLQVPMAPHDGNSSFPVTPRSPVRQHSPAETDTTADDAPLERPRLSTSAARRMRRKRAAERAQQAAEQSRNNEGTRTAPLSAGRVKSDSINSILEHCDLLRSQLASGIADEVQKALAAIQGHVWQLSQHATGCRLVQLALETGCHEAALLTRELHGHVQEAAVSPHANYVIQKVVSTLTWATSSFVAKELLNSCARLARHRYACRIFCRLQEFCGNRDLTLQLIDELLVEAEDLCRHNFGHHVVQSVLEHGHEKHRKVVATILRSDLLSFAKHRNASYLVEKALSYCALEDQQALLAQLGRTEVIVELARSQFGCYVAKSLLQDERVNGKEALRRIQALAGDFGRTRHGQRLLVEIGLAEELA
ncbi:Pumilio homolog 5 (APUM-5) (AtPUM5) [Durusdinium trenchii]|uniref:Pumilio homolog 5 (APUM-5) (AtPUM5) n=1 Tax=Durusdinium trenchii TaxID=1381693 RepID=A0ABP0QF83_9DINO